MFRSAKALRASPLAASKHSRDWIAGLSIAGLLLPEAVAYASLAAMPPQAGVIALFAGLVCYGLFGTSRYAVVSATSSSAVVLAASTALIANGDAGLRLTLAIGLVLSTGVLFILASIARLGSVTAFIAKPVLRGFTFGLALVIIFKQFASIVGVHLAHSDLLRMLSALLRHWQSWNWVSIGIAATAFTLLQGLRGYQRLPTGLLVIGLGIAAGKWLDLSLYGVNLVGAIELSLALPALPVLSFTDWLYLVELGVAMVLILYAESYGSIRSFAVLHGDAVAPNRDLLALGLANLVSGLFHGMPVGAGYSATSANEAAGAVSRRAGGYAALVVLGLVLVVLPYIALTPQAVLAAIVIYAVAHALRLAPLRRYFSWRRDRLVTVSAVACVLLFGVLDGLLAAVTISLLMLLRQLSSASLEVLGRLGQGHDFVDLHAHAHAQAVPGVLILRPDEPLFFANVERVLGQARTLVSLASADVHTVILSLEESADLDGSSLEALQDFFAAMRVDKKHVWLARLKDKAHAALAVASRNILPASAMSSLSVDETVRLAQAHSAG